MATRGSSASAAAISSLGYPVTKKLARNNFPLWKAQVLSVISGAQVDKYLSSKMTIPLATLPKPDKPTEHISNPDYKVWVAKDQQIFNYLLSSLSQDILT